MEKFRVGIIGAGHIAEKMAWTLTQMDQAQADKNIAQARAEERRAMAVALEQEMKARLRRHVHA